MIVKRRRIIECMGGWCGSREVCAHYYADSGIRRERLCQRDEEHPEKLTYDEEVRDRDAGTAQSAVPCGPGNKVLGVDRSDERQPLA